MQDWYDIMVCSKLGHQYCSQGQSREWYCKGGVMSVRQKAAGMVEVLWIAAQCGGTDPATRTKTLRLDVSPFCPILRLEHSQEIEHSFIKESKVYDIKQWYTSSLTVKVKKKKVKKLSSADLKARKIAADRIWYEDTKFSVWPYSVLHYKQHI